MRNRGAVCTVYCFVGYSISDWLVIRPANRSRRQSRQGYLCYERFSLVEYYRYLVFPNRPPLLARVTLYLPAGPIQRVSFSGVAC